MKTALKFLPILFAVCSVAHAQVAPAATGPSGLPIRGDLQYSLRFSQNFTHDDTRDDRAVSTVSASVNYKNSDTRLPFSLTYGGGNNWTETGTAYNGGLFQNLLLSQGVAWRKWNFSVNDNVSYRHQSPTTGYSGVAGSGDLTGTTTGTTSSQSILTENTRVIENTASGALGHSLNHATSMNAGASSNLLRYPDGNGLDTDTLMANLGVTRRLNARNSFTGSYMFSEYSYSDSDFKFTTNAGYFGFMRMWNRKVTTNISVGPQWTGSSNSLLAPSSTMVAVNASISYQYRFTSTSLAYSRGTRGGSGYTRGTETDNVHALLSREFGKNTKLGIDGSYNRNTGLQSNGETNSIYAGAQATRKFGRYMNVFASYTALKQTSSLQSSSTISNLSLLNSLQHTISFGIGYSPRKTHLKQ